MTAKRAPLTKYEKRMRAGLREAIKVFEWPCRRRCPDCEFDTDEQFKAHDALCIVTAMRAALRRPR